MSQSQEDFPAFSWSFPLLSQNGSFSPEPGNLGAGFSVSSPGFSHREASEAVGLKSWDFREKEAFSMENSALPPLLFQGGIPNGRLEDEEFFDLQELFPRSKKRGNLGMREVFTQIQSSGKLCPSCSSGFPLFFFFLARHGSEGAGISELKSSI